MTKYTNGFTPSQFVAPDVMPSATKNLNEEEAKNLPTSKGVGTPTATYNGLMARWELPLHLMGGTLSMRQAGTKYLPQEPGEEDDQYDHRLTRTILYGIYSRTIKSLAAIPFIDPIIEKNVPPELSYVAKVATDDKKGLREFAQALMEDKLNFGLAHFLVDYPYVPGAENLNLAQERALGLKPFFVHISPANLIGWIERDGQLAEIRIKYDDVVPGEDFSEKRQERVRVITPYSFTDYIKETAKDKSVVWNSQEPILNPLGYIPLITSYGNNEEGPLRGTPVLEELAWINLKHYQKQSDLDNIEHVANTPFLFASGFGEDELNDVVVGVNALISTTREGAEIRYVEHTGAAIGVTQQSIKSLEQRAAVMGAEFLSQAATNRQTAYSKSVDTGRSLSILQAIINNLSIALAKGYEIAAEWMGIPVPEDISITVGEGIDLSLDNNDFQTLINMSKDGILTIQDLQFELQRRGKISDSTVLKEPVKTEPLSQEEPNSNPLGENNGN